ncbi:MAG: DHA2 family efflux MFS transporter permease subunit [Candidatus Melainabacteria bacterium]|nr:DHA2 family efflux MFS transporter permease subunit [Candidatus Melainabacteria bacterium]
MKPLTGMPLFAIMFALSLATFMIVLDYSIANVSIPYISGDLAVAVDQGTYVITSFAVGNAIALPVTGWLTKKVGAVKLICISLALFTLLSWVCGTSLNIEMLVISRFFQGLVAGPLIPLSQTLLVMSSPPEKKNSALATWSTIVIAAPILGPILGGWISYDYHWPWIFYINIPVGILSILIIWTLLKNRETPRENPPVDWFGLFLLAIGVTCLQFLLDKGEQYDWLRSNLITTCAVASTISFILLFVWSKTTDHPLIELQLFKIRTYALSVFYIAIMYAIYFGSIVLVPLWLQTSMNYTAPWAGIAVAPIGIAPLLLGQWSGKLLTKYGHTPLLGICFVLFAISCFYTAYFDTDVDIWHVMFSRFLLGCAMVFFITPLFALSLQDIPHDKLASATGIFHFVRAMVGGIGTSIFTTLWIRRSAYHHATVGENLTSFSKETASYLEQLKEVGLEGKAGLAQMNAALGQQADILSINDCFYLMGWIFLGLLLFLPIGRPKKNPAKQETAMPGSVNE